MLIQESQLVYGDQTEHLNINIHPNYIDPESGNRHIDQW